MTQQRPFVHLHCHTHYSLLDGANRIPDLVKKTKETGMNACAITDHGNLYGAMEFYTTCRAEGVKPIIGYEAYVAPGRRTDRSASRMKEASFHLTLLAMNAQGFKNLIHMASVAYLEGFYYKPRIDKDLLAEFNEGIICLSGCASSELSNRILGEDWDKAKELIGWFDKTFGDRFYLEIQNSGIPIQKQCLDGTVDLAKQVGIPLVATNDSHYLCQEDAAAHDVLLCVNTRTVRSDAKRMRMDNDQFFVRTPEQMYEAFAGLEDAVARSQEIADRVDIELDLNARHFPVFRPPQDKTDTEYLREICEEGMIWRYGKDGITDAHRQRLDYELSVIDKMGYASYFLIVWDFVRFAQENNIPCSARGSACGAIVAYVLGLSHVCPLEYDLLFERFLDPSRSEPPDIDIDFCRDRRQLVIDYTKQKYGVANVAQIGTFGTLKAKMVVRDVGRALGVPLPRVNEVAKMVPDTLNIKLKDAIKESPDLKDAYDSDPQIRELLDIAQRLEGLARSAGTHAAGVVVADEPISHFIPLQRITGKEDIITQWDGPTVELAGLLKMDFLGLRNLTILDKAVLNVQRYRGEKLDPLKFPLDDKETFALLQRGETKGIFQLESGGMRDLLTKMRPDRFEDVIATSALYRPGPLEGGMVMEYVNVKHGRQDPRKIHPVVDEVLAPTNGVLIFQEQVMRILNRVGDIPLPAAYRCIKAISKKKLKIIAEFREQYIQGSKKNGIPEQTATELFELIEKFAGYGFNKCVVGETTIMDADTGERTTVGDLFHASRPFRIHALGEDFQLHARNVTDVVWNGRKQVFELTTRSGRRITATANHPFRTIDGWTNLEQLRAGDRIAASSVITTACEPATEISGIDPHLAPVGAIDHSPRRQPWDCVGHKSKSPGRGDRKSQHETASASFCRPYRGFGSSIDAFPLADARGYGLSPLPGLKIRILESMPICSWEPTDYCLNDPKRPPESDLSDSLLKGDVYWDTVVSIEPKGIQDIYDLEVEQDHNFVADGLIVHNSHSVAYGAVAYQTAYLKAHYPCEFMAALLSCGMEDSNRIAEHVDDCRRMKINVLPPEVNSSDVEFGVVGDELSFGLGAIKGVGESAVQAIVAEREANGAFQNIYDLTERIDPKALNKAALETLIKAGALDSFGANRAQHMAALDRAVQAAQARQRDKARGQKNLFGGDDEPGQADDLPMTLPEANDWTHSQKLAYEKEVLGFYLTSHPLTEHAEALSRFASTTAMELKELPEKAEVMLAGMVSAIKKAQTKKPSRNGHSRYVNFDFEDPSGVVRCIMWPEEFARVGHLVEQDALRFIKGRVDQRGREPNIIVDQMMTIEEVEKTFTDRLAVKFQQGLHDEQDMRRVRDVLARHPGQAEVVLLAETPDDVSPGRRLRFVLAAPDALRVACTPALKSELAEAIGENHFKFHAAPVRKNGPARSVGR